MIEVSINGGKKDLSAGKFIRENGDIEDCLVFGMPNENGLFGCCVNDIPSLVYIKKYTSEGNLIYYRGRN